MALIPIIVLVTYLMVSTSSLETLAIRVVKAPNIPTFIFCVEVFIIKMKKQNKFSTYSSAYYIVLEVKKRKKKGITRRSDKSPQIITANLIKVKN